MNKKPKEICIGERIREIFEKSDISISQFADLLHCDRANVYNLFRRKKIDIELLLEVSEVLNHNFVEEVCAKHGRFKDIFSPKISLVFELNDVDVQTVKTLQKTIKQLKIKMIREVKK